MQPKRTIIISLAITLVLVLTGCGGSAKGRTAAPMTLLQLDGKGKPLPHSIAAALVQKPTTRFGAQLADHFFSNLVETIRKEDLQINLVTPGDNRYPEFMARLDQPGPADTFNIGQEARLKGFQGFLTASISGISPEEKKTGILWFRKTSYFINYTITMSLYDAVTAAKIVDEIREDTLKIDLIEYESFSDHSITAIEDLDEKIEEIARDFGQKVAETLEAEPWKTTITTVKKDHVFFNVGESTGLQIGDRLIVLELRRALDGPDNAQFSLPGPKIGDVRVIAINGEMGEAVIEEGSGIQEGDVVVAVK